MIPTDWLCLIGLDLLIITLGFLVVKKGLLWVSWVIMIAAIYSAQMLVNVDPPVLRMLAIIAITFTGMKIVTTTKDYQRQQFNLKFIQWLAFVLGWAGMRAKPFESLFGKSLPGGLSMIIFGTTRLVAGIILIVVAHQMMHINGTLSQVTIDVLLLVGLSLVLHFGILSISAGLWRFAGVDVQLLFNKPAKAITLAEFWGRRWNLAFIEMTSICIFRPLKKRTGQTTALMLSFIFSGLLHELALSLPVKSGYGLPLLYFFIQAIGVILERFLVNRKAFIFQYKIASRLWTMLWIVLPVALLFHSAFMQQIVWVLGGK